mmetsp:Transcript_25283/g.53320  ORF Transcript_25283/g.53320 Transcript_25283/m.53320 type:complete len:437 (+) Transcript_25283:28-1338(+)
MKPNCRNLLRSTDIVGSSVVASSSFPAFARKRRVPSSAFHAWNLHMNTDLPIRFRGATEQEVFHPGKTCPILSNRRSFSTSILRRDRPFRDNGTKSSTKKDSDHDLSCEGSNRGSSSRGIGKGNGHDRTTPLDKRAATAILSQLSSPPNILTLSRIIATPYLSYMLISHHNSTNSPRAVASAANSNGDSVGLTNMDRVSPGGDATIIDSAGSPGTEAIISTNATDFNIDAATDALSNAANHIDPSSTPFLALSLFLAMGLTDYLDGYIARKYPSTATVLGTYLDPLADKIFINVMSLTLWYTGILPGPLVGLWMVRDVGLVGTSYWKVKVETEKKYDNNKTSEDIKDGKSPSGNNNFAVMDPQNTPLKVQANFMSKVNTTLQIGLISLGIAGEIPFVVISPELITSLCWITAGTTITSSLGYLDGSALKQSGNKRK